MRGVLEGAPIGKELTADYVDVPDNQIQEMRSARKEENELLVPRSGFLFS
jgi:hypothetical protein